LNWNNWKWRGAWSSATAYKIGDSVSYLGASYTAVAASTNKPPATNLTSWNVLAAKGATGAQGATGSSGVAECSGIPHFETNWTVPGSTPGNGCFFEEANLAGVQLRTSDLTNADLQRANLQGTNFIFSTLAGVNFTSADLTGASLALTQTQNAVFSGANLTGVSFHSANLTGATLSGATIDASTTFNFTGLASCKCQSMFFSALIENANADSADFSHSTLTGIKQLTLFTNVNFTGATLAANFDRSDFTGANLTNAVWFDAVCPDGTQSSSDGNSCAGHGPGL
jgi:uncharacterized protein YjbI with pentapeptide repeats